MPESFMLQQSDAAPIVLFTYNRPWHTQQTVEALKKNELAAASELLVFSDGPKNDAARVKVEEVRSYLKTISGFKRVQIYEHEKNFGLSNNIIDGVTKVVNEYGKVIVLEDDLISSPYFLLYANDGLRRYADDHDVISVTSYIYNIRESLPETFFIKGADCLGWATWKRGWDLFEKDPEKLLKELVDRKLTHEFDFKGSYPYTDMLKNQIKGKVNSWAIRWYASAFLKDKLTLYPGRSLIFHNGGDGSGTHSGFDSSLDVALATTPIMPGDIAVAENKAARKAMAHFFRVWQGPFIKRLLCRIKKVLCS